MLFFVMIYSAIETKFFQNRNRDFFSETKFSKIKTEIFFRDQIFLKPKLIPFILDQIFRNRNFFFRNRNQNPQKIGKSFETEKFRNRNVNLWSPFQYQNYYQDLLFSLVLVFISPVTNVIFTKNETAMCCAPGNVFKKHHKNCIWCSGHSLTVSHKPSMSRFKFH